MNKTKTETTDIPAAASLVDVKKRIVRTLKWLEKRKAVLDRLKAKYDKLNFEYRKELDAISPETKGASKRPKPRRGKRVARGPKRANKPKATNALSAEQAAKVFESLPNSFMLADFSKKVRELFPDCVAKGAIKLLQGKITKVGGKGMALKFKKA